MSVFLDNNGDEWRVRLDAFTLDDVRKETGVDLADVTAGGWQAVASDAGAVGRVLAVVCGDEIRARKKTAREFAGGMRGEAIDRGREALLAEGADFFPPSEWSAIRSNLTRRTEATQQAATLRTALAALDAMPPEMRAGAAAAIGEMFREAAATAGSSPNGAATGGSVPGPAGTPAMSVSDSPASAELTAVG